MLQELADTLSPSSSQRPLRPDGKWLELIYDNISESLFLLAVEPDECYRFVSVNEALLRTTGLTREQIIGKRVEEVIPETAHALVLGKYREALGENRSVTWEEVSEYPAGRRIGEVMVTPMVDETTGLKYLIGAVHDITALRAKQEALSKTEEMLDAALRTSREGFVLLRLRDEMFLNANDGWLKLVGFERGEVIGKTTADLNVWGNPRAQERFAAAMREHGGVQDFEFTYRRKTGELREASFSAEIIDFSGEPCAFIIGHDITDAKRAEQALAKSEKNYRSLVDTMNEGLGVQDKDGIITFMNRRACEMLGYELHELVGKPVNSLFDEENRKILREQLELRRKGVRRRYDIEWMGKDGRRIPTILAPNPVFDEQGNFAGSVAVFTDITERKRAEDKLRHSEELLSNLINHTSAVIYIKELDGRFRLINRKFQEMFGLSRDEIVGKTDHDLFPKEIADVFRANDLEVIESRAAIEREEVAIQLDGPHTFISVKFPLLDADGVPYATCGISTDITERKRAEEALAESEARLRAIVQTEPECVKLVGMKGELLEMNPAGLAMLEAGSFAQVQGRNVSDIVVEEHRAAFTELTQKVLRGGSGALEYEIVGLKGTRRWLETHAVPMRDRGGEVRALLGVTRDITERKRAEEALRDSTEQLRALSARLQSAREEESTRISREIHDELGQALTSIIIELSWLEEKLFERGGTQELVAKIRATIKLTSDMVNTVRRIATELRPGLLDDFGLMATIEWQAREFQKRTGVECELMLDPSCSNLPPPISTTVYRILQESLTNIARHAQASRVKIELSCVGENLTLCVLDDGRGARLEELRDPRSLGVLGMRERAFLLGGEVEIIGQPGAGTIIKVLIPLPAVSSTNLDKR